MNADEYQEDMREAVIGFAERVAAWITEDAEFRSVAFEQWLKTGGNGPPFKNWIPTQILAAARGERTLP